jgi:hypothetical protein
MSDKPVPWRSVSCEGERCSVCGEPASAKVGEEIMSDDPFQHRHNLTAYLCAGHFTQIMGQGGVEWVDAMRARFRGKST